MASSSFSKIPLDSGVATFDELLVVSGIELVPFSFAGVSIALQPECIIHSISNKRKVLFIKNPHFYQLPSQQLIAERATLVFYILVLAIIPNNIQIMFITIRHIIYQIIIPVITLFSTIRMHTNI